uniref:AlNc14C82G5352 protein n=1 Tax=Albugo laibachii Nc14 TaxID=890382 RepID=F0WFG3_9STRA|nr:AlNc14C82G5352 [Albugo laibachii Nc14]|eukprot:CCA19945.1 AlNc14C82G5352 [Albugo laibachii Nc14]
MVFVKILSVELLLLLPSTMAAYVPKQEWVTACPNITTTPHVNTLQAIDCVGKCYSYAHIVDLKVDVRSVSNSTFGPDLKSITDETVIKKIVHLFPDEFDSSSPSERKLYTDSLSVWFETKVEEKE